MGLAASQARLLLLTARRSDLEFRAQMITQQKLALATETEQIATAYSEALGDQHLMFTFGVNQDTGTFNKKELSYSALMAGNMGKCYRLVDREGNVVYVNKNDLNDDQKKGRNMAEEPDLNLKDNAYLSQAIQNGMYSIETCDYVDPPKKYKGKVGDKECEISESVHAAIVAWAGGDAAGKTQETLNAITGIPAGLTVENVTAFIDSCNLVDQKQIPVWRSTPWTGMSEITKELNTANDQVATGVYNRKTAEIQQKDKLLDVQLKQIETQLEAVKSEQESVKSLIKDRAGKDFKAFG